MKRIAFVIQRYGEDIVGGSETYCKEVVSRLKKYYEVDVITTCAKDYQTWTNEYPEGLSQEDGINVYRFPTDVPRFEQFNEFYAQLLSNHERTILDEIEWMKLQGPYSSKLLKYLRGNHYKYDAIFFVTYIYFNTYFGMQIAPHKSFLIPTAHDEPPIYFSIFDTVFSLAKGFVFLTPEEKNFVYSRFPKISNYSKVIGMGIENESLDVGTLKNKGDLNLELIKDDNYILYIGRIDESKNADQLIEYFLKYTKENNSSIKLYLAGSLKIKLPKNKNIKYLGFVTESEKNELLKNAKVFILPSQFESFSIATLEALNVGTPVLVNGLCNVLKGHVLRSNAGLSYTSYEEFNIGLSFILNNTNISKKMSENGKSYISANYKWEHIEREYLQYVEGIFEDLK